MYVNTEKLWTRLYSITLNDICIPDGVSSRNVVTVLIVVLVNGSVEVSVVSRVEISH